MFDSRLDTYDHIRKVTHNILKIVTQLQTRILYHDSSKLEDPEKSLFDIMVPELQNKFGSPEYTEALLKHKDTVQMHYANNPSHHPEAHVNGVSDMSLIDMLEMLADWYAASLRRPDEPFYNSLRIQYGRYSLEMQTWYMLLNTALSLGWIKKGVVDKEYQEFLDDSDIPYEETGHMLLIHPQYFEEVLYELGIKMDY